MTRPEKPNTTTQGQTAPTDRIKEILKERNMTQQNLAEKMGLQLQSVKQMLNKESIRTDTLKRIADALNIPMWQLFVSSKEINDENNSIVALIKDGNKFYSANTKEELLAIANELSGNKSDWASAYHYAKEILIAKQMPTKGLDNLNDFICKYESEHPFAQNCK